MDDETRTGCAGFILGMMFATIVVAYVTVQVMESAYRTQAVSRGVAEWQVSVDGTPTFHWLHEPKAEAEPESK